MTRPTCSKSVLEILAERESIFRLLPQTTSENIAKDYKNYTVDPTTRYPNLNKYLYSSHQMEKLYINDDGTSFCEHFLFYRGSALCRRHVENSQDTAER